MSSKNASGRSGFGKGIIGKPSEQEAEQAKNGGIGTEKTLNYGGGTFEQEAAGLQNGVNVREAIDPSWAEPEYNYEVDEFTGNAVERKVGRVNNHSATGKAGKKFEIGEM
jgi:hypothetical protein